MPVLVANQPPALVGRQPIFDRSQRVYGYELLFRLASEEARTADRPDGTASTAQVVLNTFLEIGLDSVVGDRPAFVNATRSFICDGLAAQLPPDRVVIEVLEDIAPDDEVVAELAKLRSAGYTLALDDFIYDPSLEPLIELAHIIKIDLSQLTVGELERYQKLLGRPGLRLLAERVETHAEFEHCKSLGFELFQGFFLAKPSIVQGNRRTSNQVTALRLLALLDDPDASLDEVELALSTDPTLSYRLLRVINSAAFSLRNRVDSLRQALIMLGLRRVQGWVTLMVLAGLSKKPPALLETALTRARMCEQLGARLQPNRAPSFFTVGLFSALEAMLDTPLEQLVGDLPLSSEVVAALLSGEGLMGSVLSGVLAYERCEWDRVSVPGLDADALRQAYLDTLQWVRRALDQQTKAA
jgi:EAL and modified HD-GYP domain-containing signal transduction protein